MQKGPAREGTSETVLHLAKEGMQLDFITPPCGAELGGLDCILSNVVDTSFSA